MKRLLLVAAASLCAGCADALLGPAPRADRAGIFNEVWTEFDLHYSFFPYKPLDWDTLAARYRPLALAAPTDEAFAAQLGAMLRELKDVHVSLTPASAGSAFAYISPYDTIATYFDAGMVFERYVSAPAFTSGRHIRYGWVAPNVGYAHIPSFAGEGWEGEMDEVIDSLRGATSLIVDVRNNSGGSTQVAIRVAGRFAAATRAYGYVRLRNGPAHDDFTGFIEEDVAPAGARRFRGPVYVLTNRHDFSSAEDFVLAARALPRVTVVGDTTAGASGGPIVHELPNGWTYALSEWIEYTPAKRMFEGVGLPPDVVVKGSAADAASRTDAVLARAIALTR